MATNIAELLNDSHNAYADLEVHKALIGCRPEQRCSPQHEELHRAAIDAKLALLRELAAMC